MEKKNYKWHLRDGSRKEICPNCGKRRFVPYVDAAGNMAGAEYGRCDREDNCGYIKYPNGIETDAKPMPVKVLQPIRFAPVVVSIGYSGNLYEWAKTLIGSSAAINAWYRYKVGAFNNYAIFWQIAIDYSIRAGKLMEYNENGHRVKDDEKAHVRWAHKSRYYDHLFDGEELEQCFFGEHLLSNDTKKVAIVESEKTAIIMSHFEPHYIWIACGGSCGLKNEKKNKVLKGRSVILFPDNNKYWEWRIIAKSNGWECSHFCETHGHNLGKGFDILDVYEYEKIQRDRQK